ncbi:MAG TPA: anti-sigma regulatory factor [Stackebrandtia sp.]|jgi:serine/threonine-protein kinase RsbW|uniref:anti-sigma regulatory factor n=1 Tax=Stackebrandtia sp. TaxID=2023065 RepID=UPI002D3B58CF|nr:anti-sigma regulatory factor [Stackebrandtia sp.]HZE40961.1 anti-sigma regulatory factor [Stackebrandtia sp.]
MTHAVDGDVLLLDVPAEQRFLPVLRTATAGLATRLGFGLDAIEDLRVAVDEAAGLMMTAADGADAVTLKCRFDVTDLDLLITIGARDIGPLPDRQSFDWRVLDTLADSVGSEISDGVTTVRLSQRRPSDAAAM